VKREQVLALLASLRRMRWQILNAHLVDLLSDERPNLRTDLCQFFEGDSALPHGFSPAPVKALDLVGKDDILRCSGDQNLKRINLSAVLSRQRLKMPKRQPMFLGNDCWRSVFAPQQERTLNLITVSPSFPCRRNLGADHEEIDVTRHAFIWGATTTRRSRAGFSLDWSDLSPDSLRTFRLEGPRIRGYVS
jgi:hypothetical protein